MTGATYIKFQYNLDRPEGDVDLEVEVEVAI